MSRQMAGARFCGHLDRVLRGLGGGMGGRLVQGGGVSVGLFRLLEVGCDHSSPGKTAGYDKGHCLGAGDIEGRDCVFWKYQEIAGEVV